MKQKGNLVVGQAGGPTAVINSSLAGVIEEALQQAAIAGIYGLRRGLLGLLAGDLVDLRRETAATIAGLRATPAAALGTSRRRFQEEDGPRLLATLRAHDIRYLAYIGGNDSMDTAQRLADLAQAAGYELRLVGVPKTIDNDLPHTDHTPGYGSAARYVALATQEAGLDAAATAVVDAVCILEVMGRDAGWVAAAASLARVGAGGCLRPDEAPHLIYVPERRLSASRFLADVAAVYRRVGHVVAVVAETVRDEVGEPWAQSLGVDDFGHRRLVGTAERLCALVRQELGLQARFDKPGTLQRASFLCRSPVDEEEAYALGRAAVARLLAGHSGVMLTLVRESDEPYSCTIGQAPLAAVAHGVRRLPDEYIAPAGNFVTPAFLTYAHPLIGGPLPEYARLRGVPVGLATARARN